MKKEPRDENNHKAKTPAQKSKRKKHGHDTAPDDDKKSYGEKNTSYTRYRA